MDVIADNLGVIFAAITAICGAVVSIFSFLKALKSEKRTKAELTRTNTDVVITREGIVQAFKSAVVTKDLKISINGQVENILGEWADKILAIIAKNEERRTKMIYWVLKILDYTAASDKLTTEQRSEINELLAMIADEEQIVDTL